MTTVEHATAVPRRPGRPPRISLDSIVSAALELGLDGLTLRKVAEHLDVTGPAIYYYVANVEELSALACDAVADRFPLPDPEGRPWKDWAHETALTTRAMLESTPGMAAHAVRYRAQSPGILRMVERSVAVAVAAGFDDVSAVWVTRAVADFVEGWVARQEAIRRTAGAVGHTPEQAQRAAAEADPELGHTRRYLAEIASGGGNEQFEFTLRLILDGAADKLGVCPASGL